MTVPFHSVMTVDKQILEDLKEIRKNVGLDDQPLSDTAEWVLLHYNMYPNDFISKVEHLLYSGVLNSL